MIAPDQYSVCGTDPATGFVEKLSAVTGIPDGRADAWTSMVLGEDGRVYVWSRNDFGLLGGTERGPVFQRQQPTVLTALQGVIGIAAFIHDGAALCQDGTVWMWGEDTEGLLATGGLTRSGESGKPQYTPQRVQGLDAIVQIAGGSTHMLALKSDGTVWSWGANRYGQLGVGHRQAQPRPAKIQALTGITRVYAFENMSCLPRAHLDSDVSGDRIAEAMKLPMLIDAATAVR